MTTPVSTEALVASRICHDLVSPVGAICNGIELLAALASTTPEMALIAESAESAKVKLQFFRICFGHATADATLSPRAVTTTAEAMFGGGRLSLVWGALPDSLARDRVKTLYLALLCVEVALPLGGEIAVNPLPDGWQITAQAPRVQQTEIWRVLEWQLPPEPLRPAQVQFILLRDLLRDKGMTLLSEFSENALQLDLRAGAQMPTMAEGDRLQARG